MSENLTDYHMSPLPEASGPINPTALIIAVALIVLFISFILVLNYWEPIKELIT